MVFVEKAVASGYHMELAFSIAILAVVAWSITCIQQPDDPFSYKHSNSQGISVHPNCPGLYLLDHHLALATVEDTVT